MRPRLSPDVIFRSYVGERGWGQVLVRRSGGARLWLSPVERAIAEACDGARGLERIAIEAAERTGQRVGAGEVGETLERLRAAGALVEKDDREGAAAVDSPPAPPAALETVTLDEVEAARLRFAVVPGSAFSCDGRGGCCRLYDLVMLRPGDVAALDQAYGRDGHLPGGLTLSSALGRARLDDGSESEDLLSMAVVEGACMLLEADGSCGVHRLLGPARKPSGCAAYPLLDVLCGDELAVGVACECRCAIDSAGRVDTGDLVPQADALLAQRTRWRRVERVTDRVPMAPGRTAARSDYAGWRSAAQLRLAAEADPLAWLLDEAAQLTGEVAPGVARHVAPAVFARQARAVLAEVADYLAWEARDTAAVYSPGDLQRRLYEYAARSAESLVSLLDAGAPPQLPAVGERLVVEQALHTHDLLRGPDVQARLLSLAVRVLVARAGGQGCPGELLPMSALSYLQRASRLGEVLDDCALQLVAALEPR